VPLFWKYVTKPEDRRAGELIVTQQVFGRPYVLPPGTPAPIAKVLRDAFMATLDDPAFRADAERARINIDPLDGEKVQAIVEKLFAAPAADIERAKAALGAEAAK
jgi:tripartite-type tricarboxylate transporter receptor subunit TctC